MSEPKFDDEYQPSRRVILFGTMTLPVTDWSVSGPLSVFSSMSEATNMTFYPSGISINTRTGEVTIPEGLPMSAASKAFWNGLHDAFPTMEWCKK
jgi:hypothetical protein